MSLGEKLQQHLRDTPQTAGPSQDYSASTSGWAATVRADVVDSIGSKIQEVTWTRLDPAPAELTLPEWAENVTERVTGLLERLKVYEVDTTHNQAVLRSDPPTVKDDVAGYYEMVLTGTEQARLGRYQADRAAGTPRENLPFTLTHEAMAKLVDDVAGR
jgi:hypothetical protein